MQLNQKRPNHAFFIFLGIAAAYAGYCFATLYGNEIHMENITELFIYALRHPLPFVITQWTAKAEAACIGIWLIAYLSYLTNQKNYMPGKEYGSARLAAPDEINRKLANKDPKKNKIVSEHVRISTELPAMNNNALFIGGSGAGKSFYIVKPNGYTASGSYLFCDPKGELLRDLGGYLELQGYRIVVLDLIDMDSSDGYNPFAYLRSDEDIVSLITNLIANTTPPNAHSADPFWEKAEGMYLQSIMLYVWYEYPKQGKAANFRGVLELLNKAKIPESENELSELDELMYRLPEDHPALVSYKKVRTGAADTVRSIIISAHSRLAYLQNPRVLRLLDKDEIDIAAMGEGVYQNPDRPTALFCKIPDNDKSYNFIVGMLYTQMFQELYRIADRNEGGKLPVPVAFWMDEFANVMLPKGFCELLSTMRGRQISCNIIIQNLAQIKALFKDTWETIPGNCDVLVYLGGNEASTHKYISEQLGKLTIDKKSTGETLGSHGSSSRNYDVIGREILSPDEIRKLDPKKCLILVKGYDAVVDWKYQTWKKQEFKLASSLGDYLHKKELDQMYLESRQQFYLSSAGIGAIMSYQIQVEDCGGIFEETDIWKLTLKTEEGYIRMPDSMKGYNYFECEVFPAFSPEAIKVQSGKNRLSKHCIAGFYDSEENLTLEDEEILESIFMTCVADGVWQLRMCKAFWQRINIFIWAICGIAEIAYRVTAEMEQLSQNESEEDGNMREMNYLTEKDLAYFEKRAEEGKAVILRIDPEELLSMDLEQAFQEEKEEPITEAEVRKWLEENDLLIGDKEADEPTQEDQVKPVEQVIKPEPIREEEGDTLAQRLQQIKLDDDQVQVLKKAIEAGLSEKEILSFLKPEFTAEKMYTIMELLKK